MSKSRKSDESSAVADQPETNPPLPTNGDSEPAKKKPRDKAESFRRVGNQRLQKAVYAMRRLIPLANRNAYTYTDEQAKVVREVALALANEVVAAFSTVETKEEPAPSFL